MLITELGNICFIINGEVIQYIPIRLTNIGKQFRVDGRYKVEVKNINVCNGETNIDCLIDNKNTSPLNGYCESGEGLALISFVVNNVKLSIGVEGDIPGVYYEYMKDRLRIRVTKKASLKSLTFYIAWLTMSNEQDEILTWFAADPTLTC
ncbi:hypothetical protein [Lutispora sp.]|uniref:hypothetical protein n=1 Tax=Lutispora sp. TaxID=2828727 RepID=UPI00356B1652